MGSVIGIPTTRVSDQFVRQRLSNQVRSDQLDLFRIQMQLSTGRRFLVPSEDSTAAARVISLQRLLERKDQVQSNLLTNQSYLMATDTALSSISNSMAEVRSVALGVIGTLATDTQRNAAGQQVRQVIQQLMDIGNQKFRGRYLFAGARTSVRPFSETGNGMVRYSGDEGKLSSYSDIDLLFETNLHGNDAFGAISNPVRGSEDMNPVVTFNTRLADLNGGRGVTPGSISISSSSSTSIIDISNAETVGDVAALIYNNPPTGTALHVEITPTGLNLEFDPVLTPPGHVLSIREVGGGITAGELGILEADGTTSPIIGTDLNPLLRLTTKIADTLGTRAQAVVRSVGTDNDFLLEADATGEELNGVTIAFVDDGTVVAGNETVAYDPATKAITVTIDAGQTLAQDVIAAINQAHGQGLVSFTARLDPLDEQLDGVGQIDLAATATTALGSTPTNITQEATAGSLTLTSFGVDNDILITANETGQQASDVRVKFVEGAALGVAYTQATAVTPHTVVVTLATEPWDTASGGFTNNGQAFRIAAAIPGADFNGVTVDITDVNAGAASVSYNHTTGVISAALTAANSTVTDLEALINNDPTVGALFTMSTTSVGALNVAVATGSTFDGVDGGAIVSTANEVIAAINNQITGAGVIVTASLASPTATGLGTVTPMQEFAHYGRANADNGLQFLGPEDARKLSFVAGTPGDPLQIDLATDAPTVGFASTILQAVNANASVRITAKNAGAQYDDINVTINDIGGVDASQDYVVWDPEDKTITFNMRVAGAIGQDVVDLVQNDPNGQVASLFTAANFGSGAGSIDAAMAGTTSGGLTGEGTVIVRLAADASGVLTTTAQELITYFNAPANAAALAPLGITVANVEDSNGSGLLAPTISDIEFTTSGIQLADAFASGTTFAANGLDAQLLVTAKTAGEAYDNVNVVFVDTAAAGGETFVYAPPTRTLTIGIEDGVSTANQVIAALAAYATIDAMFSIAAVGAGTNAVTINDTTTLTGGVVDNGTQDGAALAGGKDTGPTQFDLESGLQIVNGEETHTIDLSLAETVEDLLNTLNMSSAGVLAEINGNTTGINVRSRLSGSNFMIGENGGLTATHLGLRTFIGDTRLEDLNFGYGVTDHEGLGLTASTTAIRPGLNNDLTIRSLYTGTQWNDFVIRFAEKVPAGDNRMIYDAAGKTIVFEIDPATTTANDIITLFESNPIAAADFRMTLSELDGAPNDGTGLLMPDLSAIATASFVGGDNDLVFQARDSGTDFNNVTISFVTGGVPGLAYDRNAKTMQFTINAATTTANNIITMMMADSDAITDFHISLEPTDGTPNNGNGLVTNAVSVLTTGGTTTVPVATQSGETGAVDFTITVADGSMIEIDTSGMDRISDVLNLINSVSIGTVQARLATYGNGIELLDLTTGGGVLTVERTVASHVAIDLGLIPPGQQDTESDTAGLLTGSDVNTIETEGIFTALLRLERALLTNDNLEVQRAIGTLDTQVIQVNFARAELGARQLGLDVMRDRLESENIDLRETLSKEFDVDIVEAISAFSGRQIAFEASLKTTAQIFQMSLLNFL